MGLGRGLGLGLGLGLALALGLGFAAYRGGGVASRGRALHEAAAPG